MNKQQLERVLSYMDAEYAGIVSRMTDAERKTRATHWAMEIGSMDFNAVMAAVRKLSRNSYMPRTAEVISEVEKQESVTESSRKNNCRIFRDANGEEVLDLRHSDGTEWMTGYLKYFPDWMQIKFRWQADPSNENTLAWDNYILACEREWDGVLMTMGEEVDDDIPL